jgi:hypothetical protein
MIIVRVLGWFLFFCAALFLVRDVAGALGTDHGFKPKTVADIWNLLSPGAVDDWGGAIIHDHGRRVFWVYTELVSCWASIACFLPGLVLEMIARPHVDKPYKRVGRKVEMQQGRR